MEESTQTFKPPLEVSRYSGSPLTRKEVEQLYHRLEAWMCLHQAYLKKGLSLGFMAQELNSNSSYLSRAINEMSGKGVSQYINSFRIRAFLKFVDEGQMKFLTLNCLAKKSGFRSFSTFSRAFRMEMGCSPSSYFRKLQDN